MDKEVGESSASPVPTNVKPEVVDISKHSIISRRGFGTSGRPKPLLTNHFKVSFDVSDAVFYQYTVSISSEDKKAVEGKGIGRKLIDRLYQTYLSELGGKKFAYDGEKSLYTVGPLPQNQSEFTVLLEESFAKPESGSHAGGGSPDAAAKRSKRSFRSKTFNVEISYSGKIPLKSIAEALKGFKADNSTQDALRVLDIILRQQAANRGCLLVRQSFFPDDKMDFTDIGGGVTGVRGFHSSFRTTRGGLSLNMDVSTTMILTPGPVIDFLKDNQNIMKPHHIDWVKAKRMLKNLRVKTEHTNLEFKIRGLSEKPCNQLYFPVKVKDRESANGEPQVEDITVYDYFLRHRGIELTYSDLPCLDVGRPKKPIYLPLELCSLVSLQRYTKALSTMQRASLVEISRQKPLGRIKTVTDAMQKYCYDGDSLLSACGVKIERQLTHVDGRVLETPKLKFGDSEDCLPCNGRWNFNNKILWKTVTIEDWAVVNFSAHRDTSRIYRDLITCGRRKGIEDPQSRRVSSLERVQRMFEMLKDKLLRAPQFILCVLPERKTCEIYGPWKKKCLCDFGIVTQCISPTKINDQYLTNVLLKINCKLGGTNSLLAIEHSKHLPLIMAIPTMILGMDVSHGPPGCADIPSVAAVVGSLHWPLISRYRASIRTLPSKVEMIDGTGDGIIRELLEDFSSTSGGHRPKQIIVFRDGVGESQFDQVLNIEVEQIIKAYQQCFGDVEVPKFTVIVVQKNHHTKLFLKSRSENVPAGTVVDTKIVHPRNYDFYMCAHAGMIGTLRPAHYHVLLDEIGFSADELQALVHSLSYVYQRSTSAISVVAPVRYAHLAAQQMSQFINLEDLKETSSGSMTSAGQVMIPELPKLHERVANSMFFC